MKQFLLLLVLLLSTLVHEAQARNIPMSKLENALKERSDGGSGEVNILCKDDHCSSGRNRKLMTKTTSTSSPITTTSTKNIKNEGNKAHHDNTILKGQSGTSENFSVNSSPENGHRKTSSEHYPDVLDLAGMDYSPAKRKPPIHN
ncbi:hypothetical protein RND71_009362 [Anisodus tanguticus]|uniref:Uncharacterized protein n=1 Tax=Anisodus tanguticus TaxID=243964 RepID=A0AAE1SI52_9SOLA|nr:hypothetical protein RND71_009362 [Anisodus tanguticus]